MFYFCFGFVLFFICSFHLWIGCLSSLSFFFLSPFHQHIKFPFPLLSTLLLLSLHCSPFFSHIPTNIFPPFLWHLLSLSLSFTPYFFPFILLLSPSPPRFSNIFHSINTKPEILLIYLFICWFICLCCCSTFSFNQSKFSWSTQNQKCWFFKFLALNGFCKSIILVYTRQNRKCYFQLDIIPPRKKMEMIMQESISFIQPCYWLANDLTRQSAEDYLGQV